MYSFCLYLIVLDGVAGRRSGWLRFLSAIPSALALPPLFVQVHYRKSMAPFPHKEVAICKLSYEAP